LAHPPRALNCPEICPGTMGIFRLARRQVNKICLRRCFSSKHNGLSAPTITEHG
jgi:hypothetical protein